MNVTVASEFGEEYVALLRRSFPRARITPAYSAGEQLTLAPERSPFLTTRRLKWFHFLGIGLDRYLAGQPLRYVCDLARGY